MHITNIIFNTTNSGWFCVILVRFNTLMLRRGFILKTFAERNAKFSICCVHFLSEITSLCAILRKNHFVQNFLIPRLRNSTISQRSHYIMVHFLEKKVSRSDLTVIGQYRAPVKCFQLIFMFFGSLCYMSFHFLFILT